MAQNSTYCQSAFSNYTNLYGVFSHLEFNGCLQETILHWIPPLMLILFGIFEISYYFSKQNVNRNVPFNKLNVSKIIFISVLIVIHLSQIGIFFGGTIEQPKPLRLTQHFSSNKLYSQSRTSSHFSYF